MRTVYRHRRETKSSLRTPTRNEQSHKTIIKIDLPQPRGTVSTRIKPYELILIAGTLELSVKIHPGRGYTYVTVANEGYAHSATIYHDRPLIQAHTELRPPKYPITTNRPGTTLRYYISPTYIRATSSPSY
jgi:hypothetical protein